MDKHGEPYVDRFISYKPLPCALFLHVSRTRKSGVTVVPARCFGLTIRWERRRTSFGVRTYGVRCTCVRHSMYVHTAFDVRRRRNRKRRRNGRGGDDTKMLTG